MKNTPMIWKMFGKVFEPLIFLKISCITFTLFVFDLKWNLLKKLFNLLVAQERTVKLSVIVITGFIGEIFLKIAL